MKRRRLDMTLVLASFLILAAASAPMAHCADKKVMLQKANQAYYNLKNNGLIEFSCQVLPDWDAAYKDIKMDAVGRDQVLPIAKQMRFQVAVGPSGAASVSHQSGGAPPSEEVAERLRKITGGMEHMLSGFFRTWSQLMINSPLPGSDSEYQVDELSNGYRFTADAETVHMAVFTNREFVIDSMEAKTSEFEGTVYPKFAKHAGGLLLDSYEGTYTAAGASPQKLSVKIQYQEVQGLPLPRTITMTMSLPQGRLAEPLTLTECQIKKK
jgi:hypothetical protein